MNDFLQIQTLNFKQYKYGGQLIQLKACQDAQHWLADGSLPAGQDRGRVQAGGGGRGRGRHPDPTAWTYKVRIANNSGVNIVQLL